MEYSQKFLVDHRFAVEVFDHEILLYAVSCSSGIYLNESAYLVWELCGKGLTIGEIVSLLEERYPQQGTVICKDVIAAIESLVGCGALIVASD